MRRNNRMNIGKRARDCPVNNDTAFQIKPCASISVSLLATNSHIDHIDCVKLTLGKQYHVLKYYLFASGCSFWLKAILIDQIDLFTRVNSFK